MQTGKLYINGQWVAGNGAPISSTAPTTGDLLLEGQCATDADMDKAVSAARTAFEGWALTSLEDRISIIKRYQDILKENQDSIARLISDETGKVLWEARTEAATMIGKIDLSITSYMDRTGVKKATITGATAHLTHKPHGVIAVFGPFNFPGHLPNGHIVPALIAGNCIIFKPSDQTPATGELMVRYWELAGLPAGVLNLVQGARDTGVALSTHAGIDGLFFTGSSRTGALLHSEFAGHPAKILALEMGGNNPLIVTDISDIEGAVYHTIQSAFITAGQRCTCARRLIVPAGRNEDVFLDALISATQKIKVGPQEDNSDAFMGSVISNIAADDLLAAQENIVSLGGKICVEMKRLHNGRPYLSPGIIDVTNVAELPDEEYFGPFLQVIRVADFDAAITTANNTRFGLSAGVICDDPDLFKRFHAVSRAGIVNWNRPLTGASGANPFGGIGDSGNHRPSAFYAADYCAYPVASVQAAKADLPAKLSPGIDL